MYEKLLKSLKFYGSDEDDICALFLGVVNPDILEKVVIAPWWEPEIFDAYGGKHKLLNNPERSTVKVWEVSSGNGSFTYIKTGIGAAVLADVVLALGITRCREILFIGSAGSLDNNIRIGDIVIPEYSICGDGTSRYLKDGRLSENDSFGEKSFPDKEGYKKLVSAAEKHCSENNVKLHIGRNFSVDTILAQFPFLGEIQEMGCNVIEMETAAAFRAAEIAGLSLTALFSVSDNIIQNKSLVSGRTEEENNYRKTTRRIIFPRVIESYFFG